VHSMGASAASQDLLTGHSCWTCRLQPSRIESINQSINQSSPIFLSMIGGDHHMHESITS
jgi:hypothetical protein